MTSPIYKYHGEPCRRYIVEKLEILPEGHRQEYLKNGDDPDNRWRSYASFSDRAEAVKAMYTAMANRAAWQTYRVRDMDRWVETGPKTIKLVRWVTQDGKEQWAARWEGQIDMGVGPTGSEAIIDLIAQFPPQ